MDNNILTNDIAYLKGVGAKRSAVFNKAGIYNIKDLLLYFPTSYINVEFAQSVNEIAKRLIERDSIIFWNTDVENYLNYTNFDIKFGIGEVVVIGVILSQVIIESRNRKKILIISVKDDFNSTFEIVIFSMVEYYSKKYRKDMSISVSGRPIINEFSKKVQFHHPIIDIIDDVDIELYVKCGILPKYRITEEMRKTNITIRYIRNLINSIISGLQPDNKILNSLDTLPEYILQQYSLLSMQDTIYALHNPTSILQINKARYRIKFEELFWYELQINLTRTKTEKSKIGILITNKSKLARQLYDGLPFSLTYDQKKVLRDFDKDFKSGRPMNRLLQGDVGAGKTIVALFAMLMAIDAGYQVVLMAPTEILAEQHYITITNLVDNNLNFHKNLNVELLIGGISKKQRNEILKRIFSGEANIVIGTHALFQNDVKYNNLGFAVIDEQHRFGVSQRANLINLAKQSMYDKNLSPHILFMTATPIPRTLTMTFYGDTDISIIKSLPKNRKPIKTHIAFENERKQVYDFINLHLNVGKQVYIVYPLVEKSEKLELKSAIEYYNVISQEIFPQYKCGLLHGQMKWNEKDETMHAFKRNEFQILIATTVVEVGIDVPNATIMVIEDASQFGLSQLHQLRGRVGRGTDQSFCFLMTKDDFKYKFKNKNIDIENEKINAIIRLKAMKDNTDGFALSEIDLKLRGPGDILGTKQSGLPEFKYVDLINDVDIIQLTSNIAKEIIRSDTDLKEEKNIGLRKIFDIIQKQNFINIA